MRQTTANAWGQLVKRIPGFAWVDLNAKQVAATIDNSRVVVEAEAQGYFILLMRIISSLVLYRLQQCNVYLNLGKDADSKHSPDAADAVGDERAAWIIQVWLAVEELNRISFLL